MSLLLALPLFILGGAARPAEALELPPGSISHEIHITARVKPTRTIIVDAAGDIQEIASNSPEDVLPEVYLDKPGKENARPLTPELHAAYTSLVAHGTGRAGILYRRQLEVATLQVPAHPLAVALQQGQPLQVGLVPFPANTIVSLR